jgi:hypothetical protein
MIEAVVLLNAALDSQDKILDNLRLVEGVKELMHCSVYMIFYLKSNHPLLTDSRK